MKEYIFYPILRMVVIAWMVACFLVMGLVMGFLHENTSSRHRD